jgi:long-chain fatty acid transport protein
MILFGRNSSAQGGLGLNVGGADAGPMIPNAAAIFWNPGAMGGIQQRELLANVEIATGQGQYERAPDVLSPIYPEVTASVLFPLPYVGYVDNFGLQDWRFGFGAYVPFGSGGSWGPTGPQRYHLISGAEGSIFLTAAMAYKFSPKFSAGLGASYVFSILKGEVSLDLVNVVQGLIPAGFGTVPLESPLFEANAKTGYMTGHGYCFNGGLFYQPTPQIDLGLSFMAPVDISVEGPVDVTLPDVLTLGQPVLAVLGFDGRTVRANGKITMLRPPMIMAGGAWHDRDKVSLEASVIYSLSRLRDKMTTELTGTGIPYLDAPEGNSVRDTGSGDSFQIRLGSKFRASEQVLLGGYLAYIYSGIPSSHVTASNVGFNMLIPTFLTHYNYNTASRYSFSLSPIIPFTRKVNDSVFNPLAPAGSGIGVPTGNGTYRGFGIQLGLSYNYSF